MSNRKGQITTKTMKIDELRVTRTTWGQEAFSCQLGVLDSKIGNGDQKTNKHADEKRAHANYMRKREDVELC